MTLSLEEEIDAIHAEIKEENDKQIQNSVDTVLSGLIVKN